MRLDERRRLHVMLDYQFGKGVHKALPRSGLKLAYSRRSGRVKLVLLDGKTFATVRPNGSMALSVEAAAALSEAKPFRENHVVVGDEAAEFARKGKSVFCKFVVAAGRGVRPGSEVVVVDRRGAVLAVGTASMRGDLIQEFKSGVAVKVREGAKV